MKIVSRIPDLPPEAVRRILAGFPEPDGYEVALTPLRYRTRPHLAARTEFAERRITLQVPEPFLPFGEVVFHSAKRVPGRRMRFVWLSEGLTFRAPPEVIRFLYLHEWMHWYLRERLGRRAAAETACDRFALRNYQRELVTEQDAVEALRRPRSQPT